eukprot:CAMPEP_0114506450 /NCGR_PEP_ID=MMETSP0109-20121206/11432_1 /TAXON_ID=29199 /ORGANISM="Chlorarachnion reptans, Strain CCCM449" /LENGTH=474 /DNA_ID=CAMNT_0001685035 /DNA_START=180 /DNA_END=1604 /DNA_ORIENTATION=+
MSQDAPSQVADQPPQDAPAPSSPSAQDGKEEKKGVKQTGPTDRDKKASIGDVQVISVEGGTTLFSGEEICIVRSKPEIKDRDAIKARNKTLKESVKGKLKRNVKDDALYCGTLKYFNQEKGYGFILCPEIEKDTFFHAYQFVGNKFQLKNLVNGDILLFERDQNEKGGPVAKKVRLISTLHLAFATPFPNTLEPKTITAKNGVEIEIFEHPTQEKREFAPFKARVKDGPSIGSIRRVGGNKLYLLLNRNAVKFKGTPREEYRIWGTFVDNVADVPIAEVEMLGQKESSAIGKEDFFLNQQKDRKDRELGSWKKQRLEECKKIILDFMMSTKGHARSTRISSLRNVLSKKQFNPRHFGMERFTDFLKLIPGLEFLNSNKVCLNIKLEGSKRKRKEMSSMANPGKGDSMANEKMPSSEPVSAKTETDMKEEETKASTTKVTGVTEKMQEDKAEAEGIETETAGTVEEDQTAKRQKV